METYIEITHNNNSNIYNVITEIDEYNCSFLTTKDMEIAFNELTM